MDPLRVYHLSGEWGLPSMSPFGLKLLTWLRLAGIDHTSVVENNTTKGPKRKSPWIVLADGRTMGDTAHIIEHLKAEHGVDPDAHLTPGEAAEGLAIRRMVENHYYYGWLHSMFVTDHGWDHTRPHFDFIPRPLRYAVARIIRRDISRDVYLHGMGRHKQAEIDQLARDDLDGLSTLLADRPFFGGARPSLTDCTVYGVLALTLWVPVESAAKRHLQTRANLVTWCERTRESLWAGVPAQR